MNSSIKIPLLASFILWWNGCTYQPIEDTHELGEIGIPETWENIDASAENQIQDPWLKSFNDPRLVAFVDRAVEGSLVLKAGMARLAQAEASVRLQGGAKFPTLGLGFNYGRQENYSPLADITHTDINSLTLSSSWEVDLWGKIRKEQETALAQLQAAGYGYADLALTLQSTIAKTWYNAIEARNQWELAVQNRDSFLRNLKTLEDRYQKGLVDAFDLRLFRAQSATNEALVLQRESAYKAIVYQLQSLASLVPGGTFELPSQLPVLKKPVPTGIPSEVLLRRPDVRAAERQLAASLGSRNAASKNWLPSIQLTGSYGTSSNEIGELIDGDRLIWSLISSVTAPLFMGGRLEAERALTEAQFQEQIHLYGQTLLEVLVEVETALMRESMLKGVEDGISHAANEAQKAEAQAWELYQRGLRDITAVLDTQRRSVSAQSELLSIQNQRIQNRIDLHVALGGGFDSENDPENQLEKTIP